jgi:hypothetical protein
MTALVVQDILGGDLILAEVHVAGAQVGHHYWNRLPDGSDVDLTADSSCPKKRSSAARLLCGPPTLPGTTASSTSSFACGSSNPWRPLPEPEPASAVWNVMCRDPP